MQAGHPKHITHVSTRIPFVPEQFESVLRQVHTGSYYTGSALCQLENATEVKDTLLHGEKYYSISYDYCMLMMLKQQQRGQVQVFTSRCDESRMIFVTENADVIAMMKLSINNELHNTFVYVDAHVLQDDQGLSLVNVLLNGMQRSSSDTPSTAPSKLRKAYCEKVLSLPLRSADISFI